jgi:hypothetical protein
MRQLPSVACPAVKYFSTLSHKRHNFRKTLLNIISVFLFSLQLLCETLLILEEMSEIWLKMYIGLLAKYQSFLSDFNATWIFWHNFYKYSNIKFHENPSSGNWVAPCGQTDRRTDMTKQKVAFRNFPNVPKTFRKVTLKRQFDVQLLSKVLLRFDWQGY